jgi:ribokinase
LPRRPRIAVVGSVNLDLVVRADRLPEPGETVTGSSLERVPGGKGANQALAAARLGAETRLHAAVGTDGFGDEALALLREEGVELAVTTLEAPTSQTGVALIVVSAVGENQIVVAPGANAYFVADALDLGPADAVLAQLEIPLETVAAAAQGTSGIFCLNAAPAKPVPGEVLARADLVVVNRYELDALEETPRLTALTLGAEGAVLLERGEEVARAAPPAIEAVDGTAAGDAFTACLVVALLEGRARDDALRRACAAGAIAASRPGAQPSLPTAAEVDEILGA